MNLSKYTRQLIRPIPIDSVTFLFFCFVFVNCANQATKKETDNTLALLFDGVDGKAAEIYKSIPGTLIKYLETQKIVKMIKFKDDISNVEISIEDESKKSLDHFQRSLRTSIQSRFRESNVQEIQATQLASDIRKQYETQMKRWAKPGEQLFHTIIFTGFYQRKDIHYWDTVRADVFIDIIQECDKNWIYKNQFRFKYDLTIDITGISVNPKNGLIFSELLAKHSVSEAIKQIKSIAEAVWEDL